MIGHLLACGDMSERSERSIQHSRVSLMRPTEEVV